MTTQDNRSRGGWRKSPYSTNGGNCVEVSVLDRDEVAAGHKAGADKLFVMRDSKDPAGPRLYFTEGEWDAFARGMKDGAFDDLS
ncbi:MAG TPA: DUF397 domain-containing protein [Streptosporangiaceae bacterium]|nr:DUF397 domain-containing protein [Streptosporangiaceae bacterium]